MLEDKVQRVWRLDRLGCEQLLSAPSSQGIRAKAVDSSRLSHKQ